MTPTNDVFDFGNGPVPAHRHANGGGWVADTASVDAGVHVGPEAQVYGKSHVYGEALVSGKAHVYGEALVSGKAMVSGEAQVYGKSHVYGEALVSGKAHVYGEARVCGEALVCGEARVYTTPLLLTGYEFAITICDNQVQVGCETIVQSAELSADMLPEAQCPRLRTAAPLIIPIIRAHWDYCQNRAAINGRTE
jgi:UDP-3-O-[3-hydroxymyristoyl] glucosamine N-acyltransferase